MERFEVQERTRMMTMNPKDQSKSKRKSKKRFCILHSTFCISRFMEREDVNLVFRAQNHPEPKNTRWRLLQWERKIQAPLPSQHRHRNRDAGHALLQHMLEQVGLRPVALQGVKRDNQIVLLKSRLFGRGMLPVLPHVLHAKRKILFPQLQTLPFNC